MDLNNEVKLLERDVRNLHNNVDWRSGGCIIFKRGTAAEKQVFRIIARSWMLRNEKGGASILKRAKAIYQFMVDEYAMLGSKHPDDWDWWKEVIANDAAHIHRWCERYLLRSSS